MTVVAETDIVDKSDDDDDDSLNSADEALLEMLGFASNKQDKVFAILQESEEKEGDVYINDDRDSLNFFDHFHKHHPTATTKDEGDCSFAVLSNQQSQSFIDATIKKYKIPTTYQSESVCRFPKECSISQKFMRRITDEILYGTTKYPSDRSYETIHFTKLVKGTCTVQQRREITRFENFVNSHKQWYNLCHGYLATLISAVCGEEMVLFKEKLNLKPPGGTGFAPHLDSPSLRIALGDKGPSNFVTVMVAIDDMTEKNGCLRVWKGSWNEDNHVTLMEPEEGGDPDAGGRAGAIHPNFIQDEKFEPITCKGGDIVAFNGWVPHRSSANSSLFSRRAVFLTYNPAREGNYHDEYYSKMKGKREEFRRSLKAQRNLDSECEMKALNSIPKI
jgi:ectoine hydroxylase-related dioxygenase (phytanoyl-CoA dioxygenase family)